MKRAVFFCFAGLMFAAAALLAGCGSPVTLAFPDFPAGVVEIDLGQSLPVDVTVTNDAGKGVTWSCVGDACAAPAKFISSPTSATFFAKGITGTATITAKSIKQPKVMKTLTVNVSLNDMPPDLCSSASPASVK